MPSDYLNDSDISVATINSSCDLNLSDSGSDDTNDVFNERIIPSSWHHSLYSGSNEISDPLIEMETRRKICEDYINGETKNCCISDISVPLLLQSFGVLPQIRSPRDSLKSNLLLRHRIRRIASTDAIKKFNQSKNTNGLVHILPEIFDLEQELFGDMDSVRVHKNRIMKDCLSVDSPNWYRRNSFNLFKKPLIHNPPLNVNYNLNCPVFKKLQVLTLTLHLDDMEKCYEKRALTSSQLGSGRKVLWFMPYNEDISDNNKYGNVTFSLPSEKIFNKFGYQFLFVDRKNYSSSVATRLLLPKNNSAIPEACPQIDILNKSSPLHFDTSLKSAVACIDDKVGVYTMHELMVGIEVNDEDCVWLYNECTVETINHIFCNGRSHDSSSYNVDSDGFPSDRRHCKLSFSRLDAKKILEEKFPNY